jgi:cyanophycin synthetase
MEKEILQVPQSAQYVLRDPTVEFAVLETARGIYGLGFSIMISV